MKIKRVLANNRKRSFLVDTAKGVFEFPYSELRFKPTKSDPLLEVSADPELGNEALTYQLKSGATDTIPLDAVLEYNRESDYMRDLLLHKLSLNAQRALRERKITKRELSRRLRTSPAHVYRLLNQAFYGKTIDEMVRLLSALGQTVEITVSKAA